MLLRFAAFTTSQDGGNPAGVWVGDALPSAEVMQQIARDVGYSETAFVAPATGFDRTVRFFSPGVEVPFCGHATIATGVALGVTNGAGTYRMATKAGVVPVTVEKRGKQWEASLTSVEPEHEAVSDALVQEALAALGWEPDCLDAAIPPARAYAGAWHLVLAVADALRLADLAYDFEALKAFMLREGFVTLLLVWRESDTVFHARNPFPVGGMNALSASKS
ncbi:MAG: PhzF family phenazine biosynthesis isomerase [Bacteroidota bacterium]